MRFEAHCLAGLASNCLAANAGVAFFRDAADPIDCSQWVISMGDIDSLLRFGDANGDPVDAAEIASAASNLRLGRMGSANQGASEEPHSVLVGSPSREFLPPHTARALHRLMNSWGEPDPRVALVVDSQLRPSRNLVIGRKRSQFPDEKAAQFESTRVAWMVPLHRGFMLMPEDWRVREMTRLSDLF
ncbi:MAG TPA: hypothetical protein VF628_10250 [Allosphingosinicella sp.]